MSPSYIIGLAYYELGGKIVNIFLPAAIPKITALVITLYEAYNPSFSEQYNATINIVGSGRNNIKTIIWATYKNTLHFSSDFLNKQVSCSGCSKGAVNKVAQNEFSKDADIIYSSYGSPVNINLFYSGISLHPLSVRLLLITMKVPSNDKCRLGYIYFLSFLNIKLFCSGKF